MNREGNLIWECKIGIRTIGQLPNGADWPMRQAIILAFYELTGKEPEFIFSGWNATLTNVENKLLENLE